MIALVTSQIARVRGTLCTRMISAPPIRYRRNERRVEAKQKRCLKSVNLAVISKVVIIKSSS